MRPLLLLLALLLSIGGGCASPLATSLRSTPFLPAGGDAERNGGETVFAGEAVERQPTAVEWVENALYPKRRSWRRWGEQNLQTGDLVFTRGNYYVLLGAVNFSSFLSTVSDSPFSHVGIVAIEDGHAVVYDISDAGVGRTRFDRYVTRSANESVAVRRPIPELYESLPAVLQFVRQQRKDRVAFDDQFRLGNDSLYCSELIIDAYAASGFSIAEPVSVGDLPGLDRVQPLTIKLARMATGLGPNDLVHPIGNPSSGLYGSPLLVEVLPPTEL